MAIDPRQFIYGWILSTNSTMYDVGSGAIELNDYTESGRYQDQLEVQAITCTTKQCQMLPKTQSLSRPAVCPVVTMDEFAKVNFSG